MKKSMILIIIGLLAVSEDYSKPKGSKKKSSTKAQSKPKPVNTKNDNDDHDDYDDFGDNDNGDMIFNNEEEFEKYMKSHPEMEFIKEDPHEFENKKINQKKPLSKKNQPPKKNPPSKKINSNNKKNNASMAKSSPIKKAALNGRILKNRSLSSIDIYDFLDENIDSQFIDSYEQEFLKMTKDHFNTVLLNTKNYLKKNKITPDNKDHCMQIFIMHLIFEVIKDDLLYGTDEFDTTSLNAFTFDVFNTIAEDYNFFENIILDGQNLNSFDFNLLNINAAWEAFIFNIMECERCIYFLKNMTNENPTKLKEFFNSFIESYAISITFTDEKLYDIFNEKSQAYKVIADMFSKSKNYNNDKVTAAFRFSLWSLLTDKSNFTNFIEIFNPYFDFIDNAILDIGHESNNNIVNNQGSKNNTKNNIQNKAKSIINLATQIDHALIDILNKIKPNSISTHDQMQKIYQYFEKTILEKMLSPEQKNNYFNFIL